MSKIPTNSIYNGNIPAGHEHLSLDSHLSKVPVDSGEPRASDETLLVARLDLAYLIRSKD